MSAQPEGLVTHVELTETPFFPQKQYQCGPAALATVLKYRQVDINADELVPRVYLPERKGSLQIEMVATARSYGMLVYPLSPSLQDLLAEVAAGNPVLVLQNLTFNWWPQWHYAVVVGYDLSTGEIILRSGTTKRWRTSLQTFEHTWRRASYWGVVVLPPGQVPSTAGALKFISAAYDFEQIGDMSSALTAYQAASRKWPDRPEVWLTLGNASFRNKQLPAASTAFQRVTKLRPEDVRGWNNLAYSLQAQGCPAQARLAIQCALLISPQDSNLKNSYEEITASLVNSSGDVSCPMIICPFAE